MSPAQKSPRPLNFPLLHDSLLTFVPDKGGKVRVAGRDASLLVSGCLLEAGREAWLRVHFDQLPVEMMA